MKVAALAFIICCFALVRAEAADCGGHAGPIEKSPAADSGIVAKLLMDSRSGDVDAMNQLAIRYARGRGVPKSLSAALMWFRRSALLGYPAAMANLGTLYQLGAGGRPDYRRAYGWLRAALAFGLPSEDHDATVYRLGMLAAHIGPVNTLRAERLAKSIAERLVERCGSSLDDSARLACNDPPPRSK